MRRSYSKYNNFARIQGGSFFMGSPLCEVGRFDDEDRHKVSVSSFYMGKFLISQKEYEGVIGCNPSVFKGADLPVDSVNWYEAAEYCNRLSESEGLVPAYILGKRVKDDHNKNRTDTYKWLVKWKRHADGYRLPTEAEWEYACRAETVSAFYTGADIPADCANFNSGGYSDVCKKKTVSVGSFPPNPWGLYDMHGNVWEWCWDWYGNYLNPRRTAYMGISIRSRRALFGDKYNNDRISKRIDPVGASFGDSRVLRGGGWSNSSWCQRSAFRDCNSPAERHNNFGFRVVRSR